MLHNVNLFVTWKLWQPCQHSWLRWAFNYRLPLIEKTKSSFFSLYLRTWKNMQFSSLEMVNRRPLLLVGKRARRREENRLKIYGHHRTYDRLASRYHEILWRQKRVSLLLCTPAGRKSFLPASFFLSQTEIFQGRLSA